MVAEGLVILEVLGLIPGSVETFSPCLLGFPLGAPISLYQIHVCEGSPHWWGDQLQQLRMNHHFVARSVNNRDFSLITYPAQST